MTKRRGEATYRKSRKKSQAHAVEWGKRPHEMSLWWRRRLWGWLQVKGDQLLSHLPPHIQTPWTHTHTHTTPQTNYGLSLIRHCGCFPHFQLPQVGLVLINSSTWTRDSPHLADISLQLFLSLHCVNCVILEASQTQLCCLILEASRHWFL